MRIQRTLLLSSLCLMLATPTFAQPAGILLTITEPGLGEWVFDGSGVEAVTVAPAQPLSFSWSADAGTETVSGYRYGWDVVDPEDPNDPGWAIGWEPDVLSAPTRSFVAGVHTLVVKVKDDLDRITTATLIITIDPSVPVGPMSWGRLKRGW